MVFRLERNDHLLPNARAVSNLIHDEGHPSSGTGAAGGATPKASLMVPAFGQMIDHDITLTPQVNPCVASCDSPFSDPDKKCCYYLGELAAQRPQRCWPIPVVAGDHYFSVPDGLPDSGAGSALNYTAPTCLEFTRSKVSVKVGAKTLFGVIYFGLFESIFFGWNIG